MPSACARFAPPSTSKTKRKKISSSCGPHVCSCHFICPCPTAFSRAFPCKAFELLQAWLDCSRFRMHWLVSRHLRLKFACSNRLTPHTFQRTGQRANERTRNFHRQVTKTTLGGLLHFLGTLWLAWLSYCTVSHHNMFFFPHFLQSDRRIKVTGPGAFTQWVKGSANSLQFCWYTSMLR